MTQETPEQKLELSSPPNLELEDKTEEELAALNSEESTQEIETESQESEGLVNLTIDPDDISGSLVRLMREDPKVLNVINSMVGQKSATKYQPQIDTLQLELEDLRAQQQRKIIEDAPEETVNQRIARDPQFAAQYNQIMNSDAAIKSRRELQVMQSQIMSDVNLATERGMNYETAQGLLDQLQKGDFDTDVDGNDLDLSTQALNFRSALFEAMSGSPVVAQSKETPSNNQSQSIEDKLDTASPDVSSTGGTGTTGGPQFTLTQIEQMDPLEFDRNFPDADSYDIAIKEGRISGFSEGVKEVWQT